METQISITDRIKSLARENSMAIVRFVYQANQSGDTMNFIALVDRYLVSVKLFTHTIARCRVASVVYNTYRIDFSGPEDAKNGPLAMETVVELEMV